MRYLKRLAVLAAAVATVLALAAPASAAPAAGYEEFTGCPDKTVDPNIFLCISSVVDGGHLQMGSKDTPITDPVRLVGAQTLGLSPVFYVGSFDGGRQPVPGGLVGITGLNWLIYLFPNNILGLYAEPELAGTPTPPSAPNVTLPLKVKLDNVLLSDTCYIGSDTNPITLNLTTGTTAPPPPNTPITGANGTFGGDPGGLSIIRLTDRVLVDNSFAAPAASGCDLLLPGFGLIDTIVNLQAGLPSPAGTNEAVQEVDGATSSARIVYPPDGID